MPISLIKINGKISEIGSNSSNSKMRLTINENFKNLIPVLESYECTFDAILDSINQGLGSINLHSDVSTENADAPTVGQVLGWDGAKWKPINSSGSGGGGAQYLKDLDDVDDFNYPLSGDNRILVYDVNDNIWYDRDYSFYSLSEVDINNAINLNGAITRNDSGEINFAPANTADSFLTFDGSNVLFKLITLSLINDIVLPPTPLSNNNYLLRYNGSEYELVDADGVDGIRNYIPDTLIVNVNEDYQYIVHQSITIDGEFNIDGELVIL